MLQCPYCLRQGSASPLPVLNSVSIIDFFQCDHCAKISERPRGAGGPPIPVHVAVSLPQQPRLGAS